MKKLLIMGLIAVSLCSCGKNEMSKAEKEKIEKQEAEKIIDSKDVVIDSRNKIVDRNSHLSVTGRIRVNSQDNTDYVLYRVKDGRLNGETVIMDKNNKKIGSGNYINGKKNGKFIVTFDEITAEVEYKDNKQVGAYKLVIDNKDEHMDYSLTGLSIVINLKDKKKNKTLRVKGMVNDTSSDNSLQVAGIVEEKSGACYPFSEKIPYISIANLFNIQYK